MNITLCVVHAVITEASLPFRKKLPYNTRREFML